MSNIAKAAAEASASAVVAAGGGGALLGLIFSRFGIVGVLLLAGVGWLVGGDPLGLMGGGGVQQAQNAPANRNAGQVCGANSTYRFACQTLASTEDQWTAMFRAMGQTYQPPHMVFYSRGANSGCGYADSAVGPFYCPADRSVYLDTSFFDELSRRFQAPGDFAQAYVIAHEVGHHVQNLRGIEARIRRGPERRLRSGAQRAAGAHGAAGRLPRRRLGVARAGCDGGRRPSGRNDRRRRDRRRYPARAATPPRKASPTAPPPSASRPSPAAITAAPSPPARAIPKGSDPHRHASAGWHPGRLLIQGT